MYKHFTTLVAFLFICFNATKANNILVSNISITGKNTTLDYQLVNFDVAWENSWNINFGPSNHDAAWIFVKYRLKNTNIWKHATLNWVNGTGSADGHTEPLNSDIISSNDNGANGAHGVFIRRTDLGNSSVNFAGAALRWNYGVDAVDDLDNVEVSVMAIEMVYVNQGAFYVGDGSGVGGSYCTNPNTSNPYYISSEALINVGLTVGNLDATNNLFPGVMPAAYPKGFKAFYCMKYEITQTQYVAFLNKLTLLQQTVRIQQTGVVGTLALTTQTNIFRNSIRVKSIAPITQFGCDLNNDGIFDGATDGQSIACNFLNWFDVTAYLDWAALRPMTDLEFEKAARGKKFPIPNEYAWGDDFYSNVTSIINPGANNEIAQANSNVALNNLAIGGPMRVGCFAQGTTNRIQSGASYYGVLDLTGNVTEIVVAFISSNTSFTYSGLNGNGTLNANGNSNVAFWPNSVYYDNFIYGASQKGGGFNSTSSYARISTNGIYALSTRENYTGGRGVRTAP
jgi:formylglycine-generating enzyme required for sulfatase activity